ncbi:MAG: hypothetical protein ACREB5_06085 [Sphingomonadaceae bacterium]
MASVSTFFLSAAALAGCLAAAAPGEAKRSKTTAASAPAAAAYVGPVLKAYKRDPLPIYDDAGEKVRDVMRAALPPIGSEGARVVRAKPGFVGILLDGELAWLRMSMVDYVGDVKAIKCDAIALKFAKLEEEGLDQSLGLGCAK